MKTNSIGVIHGDEAYSKSTVLQRLGISQKFWDQMLDEGLPFCRVGHTRWVTGRELIAFLEKHSVTKHVVSE